jgi:hypothetical protein
MTIVARGPRFIACSFSEATIVGLDRLGRTVRFEFSEQFGPLFLRANGEPLQKQPHPRSAAWAVFEEWHQAKRQMVAQLVIPMLQKP